MLAERFVNQIEDVSTVWNHTQKRKFYKERFYLKTSNTFINWGCFHGRFPFSTSVCAHANSPSNRLTWVALGTFIWLCFNKKTIPTHQQYFPFMFLHFCRWVQFVKMTSNMKVWMSQRILINSIHTTKKSHWNSLKLAERFANQKLDMDTVPNHTQSRKFYSESLYLRSSNTLWNRGCFAEHYNVNFFKSRVNCYLFHIMRTY